MKTVILFIVGAFLLSACGSDKQGESNTTVKRSESIQTIDDNEANSRNDEVIFTSDLETTENFLFDATQTLSIYLNIPGISDERGFINICKVFDTGDINYKNCLLKKSITSDEFSQELRFGNEVKELALVIWFYDLEESPLDYRWHIQDGQLWNIN